MFAYAERKGLHIMPTHYYSPVPDTGDLPESLWHDLRMPIGFSLRTDAALTWLGRLSQNYEKEYSVFPREAGPDAHAFFLDNDAFKSGDAEILYALLRDLKPRRIVEIGSGYSTLLIAQAIRANQKETSEYRCEFVAIEPYPPPFLHPSPAEVTRLESTPIQGFDYSLFLSLQKNDVLFIDSSHTVRTGGDVVHEYLAILPILAPGVVVHIHDIFIPAEYPRSWIAEERIFWNEQYLLEAFLTFNHEFEVIMPVHAVWRLHSESFSKAIPSFKTWLNGPSSFWIRRKHLADGGSQ